MTIAAPSLDLCPSCGQQTESDVACARCGSNLRVDLWLESPITDERKRFFAARALAALALPGVTFSQLKVALADPKESLARGVPRSMARAAIRALGDHGILAIARPSAAASDGRRSLPWFAVGGVVALIVVAVVVFQAARRLHRESAPAAASSAAAAAPPAAFVQQKPAAPAPRPAAPVLTTQQIASDVMGSVAEVSCQGRLGTAFFLSPDRAATNAHVACAKDEQLKVRFKDGRELIGRTVTWEKRLDVAVIEVVGAGAKPLEIGDSTALVAGDHLVLVGNPHGLDFTVHDAKVSFVGRNVLGNAYIQVNGDVNPGNSGGPLLNDRGEVVGIVSMKVVDADGIGLALPIEYVRPFMAGLASSTPEARARWQSTVDRVHAEDAADVEKYRGKFQQPALAAVRMGGRSGLEAVVLKRWSGGPSALPVTVDVRVDDRTACTSEGTIREWEKVEQGLEKALRDSPDQPRLVWASENHVMRDVFAGSMTLDLGQCKADELPASASLVIRGGEESEAPIRLPKGSVDAIQYAEAEQRVRRERESDQSARDEASWRDAFRRLRSAVAALEAKRTELQVNVANSVPTTGPEDPRRQLEKVEAQLAKTKEALDDLERQASLAGVPRAWRE